VASSSAGENRRSRLGLAACRPSPRGDRSGEQSGQEKGTQGQDDCGSHVAVSLTPPGLGDQHLGRCTWRVGEINSHSATMYSTMFRVKVDRTEDVSLHDQVAAEIRRAIAEGEAGPGERLPPAKDLAAILEVNTNTVFRALRLLRDEGLLEFRRGRGVTVAGTPEKSAVLSRTRDLVEFARHHGYRREDVIDMIAGLP
jgi:GntR family transcriptional regulator